uniref:Uncharacterized protein LOC114338626 n=1 Tax=Diabrotica virgifera virgifera TaxID=50390 RepID=A0A6P7GMK0_DIAVI
MGKYQTVWFSGWRSVLFSFILDTFEKEMSCCDDSKAGAAPAAASASASGSASMPPVSAALGVPGECGDAPDPIVAAAMLEATQLTDSEREIILGVLGRDELLRREQQMRVLLLKNLYYNHTACMKADQEVSAKVSVRIGTRQRCVVSPMLLNAYTEPVFEIVFNNCCKGVKIGDEIINNISYGDDTTIMAQSLEDLQTLLNAVIKNALKKG